MIMTGVKFLVSLVAVLSLEKSDSFSSRPSYARRSSSRLYSTASTMVGPRIPINEDYPGVKRVHSNPDIFVIESFMDAAACQDVIDRAKEKTLARSPVAYAGWTEDFKDLVELAAKGPVAWLSLVGAWVEVKDSPDANQVSLVVHALQNYALIFVVVTALIAAFTISRADGLKSLRTSTSTTLDDLSDASSGPTQFVKKAAELFDGTTLQQEAALFEAPTVIRYEPDQVLAPHFDANRSAETEDANRGGQTLATLIVYLNDVEKGGLTRFGKLPALTDSNKIGKKYLTLRPNMRDAILFSPADAMGGFDEKTEHEGCPAVDEKWIARIWRHKSRVPPPYGLSEDSLDQL
jgi:hypothetical protein